MTDRNLKGCGLLALIVLVAVISFAGGRLSVSGPAAQPIENAVAPTPGAILGNAAGPTAVATTPTPRAVSFSPVAASPPPPSRPVATPSAEPNAEPTRARRRARQTTPATTPEPARVTPPAQTAIPARQRSSAASPTARPGREQCDRSYPTVCIPPPPPILDCSVTKERNFLVLPPDPHGLDSDKDGIGCEPIRR